MKKKVELSFQERLFLENFSSILKQSNRIIRTPELYNCKPPFIRMANPCAGIPVTLGDLCQLWGYGKFIDKCDHCGYEVYIFSGQGNFGGGTSSWRGVCAYCKQFIHKVGPLKGPSIYIPLLSTYMKFRENGILKFYKGAERRSIDEVISTLISVK